MGRDDDLLPLELDILQLPVETDRLHPVFVDFQEMIAQAQNDRSGLDLVILERFDDDRALQEEFLQGLIGDDHRKSDPFREAFS